MLIRSCNLSLTLSFYPDSISRFIIKIILSLFLSVRIVILYVYLFPFSFSLPLSLFLFPSLFEDKIETIDVRSTFAFFRYVLFQKITQPSLLKFIFCLRITGGEQYYVNKQRRKKQFLFQGNIIFLWLSDCVCMAKGLANR